MIRRRSRRAGVILMAVLVLLVVPGGSAAAEPISDVDRYLDAVVASGVPGIAVVVTRGDEVIIATGRSSAGAVPVGAQTPLRVASLSKSITSTAVLQLVEQGAIGLDEPVVAYLPEFRTADSRSERITIRQLLNQSSGLTDGSLGVDQYAAGPATAQEAIALLRHSRLAYDPGRSWDYCNANYWVAARLVEVVSGEDFSAYLSHHIFVPLGMRSTLQYDVPGRAAGVGPSHSYAFGRPIHLGDPGSFAGGAGGVVTTADDLGRWLRFQHGYDVQGQQGEVLSDELIRELHRRQSPIQEYSVGYALGWWNGEPADGGVPRISHSGTGAGTSAYAGLFPDGIAVGVLINASEPRADVIANDLYAITVGQTAQTVAGAPAPWRDLLAVVVLLAVGTLCWRGVRHAPSWADRHRRASRWVVLAALAALAVGLLVVPQVGGHVVGRQASWMVMWFTAPVPSAVVLGSAACLLILAMVRAGALVGCRRAAQ